MEEREREKTLQIWKFGPLGFSTEVNVLVQMLFYFFIWILLAATCYYTNNDPITDPFKRMNKSVLWILNSSLQSWEEHDSEGIIEYSVVFLVITE